MGIVKVRDHVSGMGKIQGREPLIVRGRVTFPVDKVLERVAVEPQLDDGLNLKVVFISDDVGGWAREVRTVRVHLDIGGEKGCVENREDGHRRR